MQYSLLLIGAHELNGVNLIPPGDDIGRERDLDAVGLEGGLGEFHHEIVQFGRWIVALPDGVGYALLIVEFNLDHCPRGIGLANTHFRGVHRFGIFQVQPFNTTIRGLRGPGRVVISVLLNIGSPGRVICRKTGYTLGVIVG
jgi:hypothetical protein